MYFLENDILKVAIHTKGAELQSIYNKQTQLEYLWCGDEKFWGKKSPVLFPIVGGLKNNEFEFEEKNYILNRHGFARDSTFAVNEIDNTTIQFILLSNKSTLLNYPFQFEFIVQYSITNNILQCCYIIKNTGTNNMHFSVGAHPAFALPLTNSTTFDDWFLEFEKNETCGIYPLTTNGLVKTNDTKFFNSTNILPLHKSLFYNDALVFKHLQSTHISIKSYTSNNGLTMQFKGFPYFGIWSAKDANFVCLEPWLGIADSENTLGKLIEKEGIITLPTNDIYNASWNVKLY